MPIRHDRFCIKKKSDSEVWHFIGPFHFLPFQSESFRQSKTSKDNHRKFIQQNRKRWINASIKVREATTIPINSFDKIMNNQSTSHNGFIQQNRRCLWECHRIFGNRRRNRKMFPARGCRPLAGNGDLPCFDRKPKWSDEPSVKPSQIESSVKNGRYTRQTKLFIKTKI